MGNGFVCCSLVLLLFVTLAPGAITSNGVEVIRLPNMVDVKRKDDIHGGNHGDSSSPHMAMMGVSMGLEADLKNPAAKVFAVIKDIEVGNTMPIYFPYINDPTSYQFLPKERTHHIPLSSKELPQLIRFFSFSPDSRQALAMKQTLAICEMEAPEGEVQGCVTSLESLNEFSRGIFGSGSRLRVLRSSLISKSTPLLQNYTVMESREVWSGKIIPCHNEPYPYAVYYCHFQVGTINKVFEVSLRGENGDRVNAVFLCHMDTSKWSAGHIAFHVLQGLKPGASEVCHFFPAYDIVVVP